MLTIPEVGQKPFSISQNEPLELLIKSIGDFTKAVYKLKVGDDVLIRGPIGKGIFPIHDFSRNVYLIGGGTGVASLRLLTKSLNGNNHTVTSFLGARTKGEILFKEDFKRVGKVHVSTDDGSEEFHGTVLDLLKSKELEPDSSVALCGPEKMMVSVSDYLTKLEFDPERIYLSLERMVKCGMGICGACEIGGYSFCQDGPVFSYSFIRENMPDFGRWKRDASGRRVPI
jgi:dihydroorotate dehydrogenase electron transfer subunit